MNKPNMDICLPISSNNISIQKIDELCINCKLCNRVCANEIGVYGTYSLDSEPICVNCGQCAIVCPVESIVERYEYEEVREAIKNPDKIVIVSTAPAVRAALGEEFGMEEGSFVQGKMVSLLRKLGVDYVLDVNFGADLTITEESSELIERITKGTAPLPQFTSCCPGWVKFAEIYYPEMLPHISSTKSPIAIQGATIKTYFAEKMGIDPKKIVNVALTPCTAKKFEIRRDEMCASAKYHNDDSLRDTDYVITTRELAKWAREEEIDFISLEDSDYDNLMGEASGAGVIFGNTGGVMEAALRTTYEYMTGEEAPLDLIKLSPVRGYDKIREATVKIGDLDVNVAVVHGTANVRDLMEIVKSGEKQYHFIEVMTCPGGCIGGGGQPKKIKKNRDSIRKARINSLYTKDESMAIRKSHENPDIKRVYEEFYGKPLSEMAEKMLHTHYTDRSELLKENK